MTVLPAAQRAAGAGHALLGDTGDLPAEALLDGLRNLRFTGTLALSGPTGAAILLFAKGQVEASFKLGSYDGFDTPGQRFHLNPHEPTDLPRLPARAPKSASPLLRALPRLAPPERLRPGAVDLPKLLDRLAEGRFDGAIAYRENGSANGSGNGSAAVALLVEGSIRAAVHEAGGELHSHAEALRALQRASQPRATGTLELEALDAGVIMPITALALERTAPAGGQGFTGLEVTPAGYRYWRAGQPFLLVPGETSGPQRRYALAEEGGTKAPEIELPSEPPGWEDQRYQLTLRGRDALDPMTELNMAMRTELGREGLRVLETLGRGETLQRSATRLGLELGKLKPWLERFETEGMLRKARR